MIWLLSALIILIPTYFYFKLLKTEPKSFFALVLGQFIYITAISYVVPVRKVLFVETFGIDLPASPPILVYLIFVFGLIAITYLFVKNEARKATKIIDKQIDLADLRDSSAQEAKESEATSKYKMRKPQDFSQESELFYKRIERIFAISYDKNCDLSINKEHEILYGKTYERGEDTPIFIKCDSSGFNDIEQSVTDFKIWIEDFYAQKEYNPVHKDIYYIYLDSVDNPIHKNIYDIDLDSVADLIKPEIKFYSETELMLKFFSVRTYLNRLIYRYKNEELQFSIRKEGEKFSLAQTFVQPSFNHTELGIDEPLQLEVFLNQWLNEDASPRQMAILGGYGTGKSSFLLHYAAKLAENYRPGYSRIPVLISLTNVSPMHDDGLKDRLSKTANEMGINYDSLMYLIEKQQVVLLLDGFDEMGYVGSREHRLQHFDSIWRLATQGNKIIIAGRPSYFFGEQELNKALQSVEANELIADDLPHCRLIKLQSLSAKEIEKYLQKYFSSEEVVKYLAFIQSHQQLFDLAARPSLMHIIREMIAEVYADNQEQYSAAALMEKYAHHWIIRQDKKRIAGSLSKDDKAVFFEQLAEWFYLNETEIIEHRKVEKLMQQFLKHIDFSDQDTKEGILGDILSGSFLQRQISNYQFVHRSFFEYFVAKRIVTYISEKESSEKKFPEIFFKLWRQEIAAFVADLSPRGALPSNLEENRFYNQSKSLLEDLSQVELERKQPISANIFSRLFSHFKSQLKLISLKNEFRKFSEIAVSKEGGYIEFEKRSSSLINNEIVNLIVFIVIGVIGVIVIGGVISVITSFPGDFTGDFIRLSFGAIFAVAFYDIIRMILKKLKEIFTNTASQSIPFFKTALINNINVRFYQQAPTESFINNALFIFLKKHLFTKALAKHDFSGWNLEGVDLSEAELQEANFSNAKLRNVNFENANLQNVNFENADLTEANLKNAKLEGADLTGTVLENT
jgi:hypothetical protein